MIEQLIILLIVTPFTLCQTDDNEYYLYAQKYALYDENYKVVLDVLHSSNQTDMWYDENSTYVNFIDKPGMSYTIKYGYNHSIVVLCNQTV